LSHPFENEHVASTNWAYPMDRMSSGKFRQDHWQSVPPMLEQRVYFGCAVLSNKIWVAGGLGVDGK